jgi:CHAT domain-containing protein
VTVQEICERLLQAADLRERERLLDVAEALPEAAALLMERARSGIESAPREGLRAAELVIALALRRDDHRSAAAGWRVTAQALRVQGRHAEALEAFMAAAAAAWQAGDARLAAQVQLGRIDSLGWLGRYEEAVAFARDLEARLRDLGAEEDAAKALVNAGSLHFRRDQYHDALACYEQALETLLRSGSAVAAAQVQTNCANVLTHLNRVDEALSLYARAQEVFAAQGMASAAAVVDTNAGFLRYVSGQHAAALAALTRARREFDATDRPVALAQCDLDIATVYRALNLDPEALEFYARAIRTFESHSVDYDRARAEMGRAAVLLRVGQVAEAEAALAYADSVFRTQRNRLQRAHVRLMRATLLRERGDRAAACMEARRAARGFARGGVPDWAAEARFLLADVALDEGQSAARRMHAVRHTARRYARGWLECRAERALGRHYARRGDMRRALRHLRAGVAALEAARTLIAPEEMHVAFLRDKLAVYEDLIGALLAGGRRRDVAEALEYVERSKSRLLLERVQTALEGRPAGSRSGLTEMQQRLAALRAELSRGYHRLHTFEEGDQRRFAGSGVDAAEALAPLEQAYRDALREAELADLAAAPGRFALASVAPAPALSAALRPDETLVEFAVVRDTVLAFVLAPGGVPAWYTIASYAEVIRTARRLRYHLQKVGTLSEYAARHAQELHQGIQNVLGRLYDLLLAPLASALKTEKVVLVPHGVLHGLPFHAFYAGAQYALERWEFVYAPSAAVWHAGVRRREASGDAQLSPPACALLMGVPGPGIERIAVEVEQLATTLPTARVFCAEEATLDAFHAHAGDCRLIHLATHALYRADNPLFSGLLFADGCLLARDLYATALDCDLATLSACRTGVTTVEPGDELFGLLRGFLAAGARAVAASLWPADDAATTSLMTRFYALLRRGESRAAALRAAQRQTQQEFPHPYHWAAFALVGER